MFRRTLSIFLEINGEQRAASFAFYAFFSLFPLILMVVSVGSLFLDPRAVNQAVLNYLPDFLPLRAEDHEAVFHTIRAVMESKGKLGLLAVFGLLWSSSHFFQSLVRAVNRAWHTAELAWWKVPLKNLAMLGIFASGLLIGMVVPLVLAGVERFAKAYHLEFLDMLGISLLVKIALPLLILFYAIMMLYKLSPRRYTTLREVWLPALLVTLTLKLLQRLLIVYAYQFWHVNAIYGTVGLLVVLLLWIHLCGIIIIFGGCLCAANAENGKSIVLKK